MKLSIALMFAFLVTIGCKAQIVDISQDNGHVPSPGTYYKDMYNLLEPFAGTYASQVGSTTVKFVFLKKLAANGPTGNYKEDLIMGGYVYIEEGVQLVNSLAPLNLNSDDQWHYSIAGNHIITGKKLGCDDCGDDENRLLLGIVDDVTHNSGEV